MFTPDKKVTDSAVKTKKRPCVFWKTTEQQKKKLDIIMQTVAMMIAIVTIITRISRVCNIFSIIKAIESCLVLMRLRAIKSRLNLVVCKLEIISAWLAWFQIGTSEQHEFDLKSQVWFQAKVVQH